MEEGHLIGKYKGKTVDASTLLFGGRMRGSLSTIGTEFFFVISFCSSPPYTKSMQGVSVTFRAMFYYMVIGDRGFFQ